jgi:sporulation protein YlmC with PRC-barrel domain
MSELRPGAAVEGSGGPLGEVDAIVIDPTDEVVTHLVVTHRRLDPRRLVPASAVVESTAERVVLDLDAAGLDACERFDEPAYVGPDETWAYGDVVLDPGVYFLEPFVTPVDGWALTAHERIPRDQLALRRSSDVHTADGTHLGTIDEFLVDPADGHVTHLVVREGHVIRHDVVVPMAHASVRGDSDVVLDLTIDQVSALPRIGVRRHDHLSGSSAEDAARAADDVVGTDP